MLNPQQIKKILQENNIAVLKKFGQNFLISESVLNKIIETAEIKPQDTVLEIGPGLGVLTFELAKKAKRVIAIEKDRKMAEILQKNLVEKNISNVEVINDDALRPRDPTSSKTEPRALWEVGSLLAGSYKLVANLPYNIATAVIIKFLEMENPPQQIVVMVQKEVAQRICASPPHQTNDKNRDTKKQSERLLWCGGKPPKMNKLAIFCQLYSTPKIIDIVPPTAFYPKPKIDSAILQLTPNRKNFKNSTFENLVSAGFTHPRKTLLNNFNTQLRLTKETTEIWLKKSGISPSQRAESLSLEQWQILAKQYPQAN